MPLPPNETKLEAVERKDMFVGWRDLRFAKGRFALISGVVMLMTLLVGFLSGLTGGLAAQNISGLLSLGADHIVFGSQTVANPLFSTSALNQDAVSRWSSAAGSTAKVSPMGITQLRAESGDTKSGTSTAVAVFGQNSVLPGSSVQVPSSDSQVILSSGAAKALGVKVGDTITLVRSPFTVEAIEGDLWYSHSPVVSTTLSTWQHLQQTLGGASDTEATILVVAGSGDFSKADAAADTVNKALLPSLMSLDSFRSEAGSLLMIIGMLFAITALVIGAFFTVWTLQRKADIAILRAMGAPSRALRRDALGQALIVLALGVGVGLLLVIGLGLLASGALPFLFSPLTTVVPALLMVLLGMLGALFAVRSITHTDPLEALGANR